LPAASLAYTQSFLPAVCGVYETTCGDSAGATAVSEKLSSLGLSQLEPMNDVSVPATSRTA